MDAQNEVLETIEQAKEVMTVRRVFGDPYEKNGVTRTTTCSGGRRST